MSDVQKKLIEFTGFVDLKTSKRELRVYSRIPEIGVGGYTLADFEALRDDLDRAIAWLKEGGSNG